MIQIYFRTVGISHFDSSDYLKALEINDFPYGDLDARTSLKKVTVWLIMKGKRIKIPF